MNEKNNHVAQSERDIEQIASLKAKLARKSKELKDERASQHLNKNESEVRVRDMSNTASAVVIIDENSSMITDNRDKNIQP